MSSLVAAVAETVRHLPPLHVESLAEAADALGGWSPAAGAVLAASLPAPHRSAAEALTRVWSQEPETVGAAVALALRSALIVEADPRRLQVEVVCTGPATMATPVRLTSEVVCQLIDEAKARVLIVSYSTQKVERVVESLDRALARGVKVTMVLESPEVLSKSGPAPTSNPYARYPTYRWPVERRPVGARLHAKVVVADGMTALLTSANLTPTAQDRSIEVGLLVRGGSAPNDIEAHFQGLIQAGELVPA